MPISTVPRLHFPRPAAREFLLSALLLLASPRARAEGTVSYKYADYRESGGRVAVETQTALIEQTLGTDLRLKLEGVLDAIAGATPTGQPAPASGQVPLSKLDDRRKAWNAEFSRQFPRLNVSAGFANSRESDYVSNGWSLNTLTDFNQKNTTLLAGVAGTDDDVKVFFQAPYVKKRGHDFIVGLTQLLDPRTSVTLNLTYGRSRGYLSDPYKLVQKNVELLPGLFLTQTFRENRPDNREKWIVLAAGNHSFTELHGALDASYRFYHDTFGTAAHTLELAWFQRLGEKFILRPGLRLYSQSAADFYYYNLDRTSIIPIRNPLPSGPHYSSDFRVSSLRSENYGVKAIWEPAPWLQLDAALERYDMHGRDGVTPASAYVRATIVTLGAKISW